MATVHNLPTQPTLDPEVTGVLIAARTAQGMAEGLDLRAHIGPLAENGAVEMAAYVLLLALPLYLVARRVRVTR